MSLIRKHGAVLQAWACLDLVISSCHVFVNFYQLIIINNCCFTQGVHWHFSWDSIAYHRF